MIILLSGDSEGIKSVRRCMTVAPSNRRMASRLVREDRKTMVAGKKRTWCQEKIEATCLYKLSGSILEKLECGLTRGKPRGGGGGISESRLDGSKSSIATLLLSDQRVPTLTAVSTWLASLAAWKMEGESGGSAGRRRPKCKAGASLYIKP